MNNYLKKEDFQYFFLHFLNLYDLNSEHPFLINQYRANDLLDNLTLIETNDVNLKKDVVNFKKKYENLSYSKESITNFFNDYIEQFSEKFTIEEFFPAFIEYCSKSITFYIDNCKNNDINLILYCNKRFPDFSDIFDCYLDNSTSHIRNNYINAWGKLQQDNNNITPKNKDKDIPKWLDTYIGSSQVSSLLNHSNFSTFNNYFLKGLITFKESSVINWLEEHKETLLVNKSYCSWLDKNQHLSNGDKYNLDISNSVILKAEFRMNLFPIFIEKKIPKKLQENFFLNLRSFLLSVNNLATDFEYSLSKGTMEVNIEYKIRVLIDVDDAYFLDLATFQSKKNNLKEKISSFTKDFLDLPEFIAFLSQDISIAAISCTTSDFNYFKNLNDIKKNNENILVKMEEVRVANILQEPNNIVFKL